MRYTAQMKQIFAAMMCTLFMGCAYYERPEPVYGDSPTCLSVSADFDDVHASVLAAVRDVDMVILEHTDNDHVRRYSLRCRNDEPASLIAEHSDGMIKLTATVGRFGDRAMERDLVTHVARRLSSLRGRDSAPLPGYP